MARKFYRRYVGDQLCPRCQSKRLPMAITYKIRKDGRISLATLKVGNDSNPACMWDGEECSLTSEQAKKLIDAADLKEQRAKREKESVETNQPLLF